MPNIIYSTINATVYDYANNYANLIDIMTTAENTAQSSNTTLHVISALPITGPTAQAYNSYINTKQSEKELLHFLRKIAQEGSSKHSDLTTLISFPWYHRDTTKAPGHPFYYDATHQVSNRPFYATVIIQYGKITHIHLESHLEYHDGGPYDARYFAAWPMDYVDTIQLDDEEIPVGTFTVHGYAIAASPTQAKQYVLAHPETQSIILNGSGFYHQEDVQLLSQSKTLKDCTLISGNPLGTDSGDKIGSGEVFVYKNGCKIYSTLEQNKFSFEPYTTQLIHENAPRISTENADGLSIPNDMIKASALWLRDYLLKSKQHGFVISMSDGINSIYTLMLTNLSIDMAIQTYGGVQSYLDDRNFGHLSCKKDVLNCLDQQDETSAIRLLKNKLLSCVFMPCVAQKEQLEETYMNQLVEFIGGSFQASEVGKVLTSNIKALKEGLSSPHDKRQLEELSRQPEVIQAAIERARVTEAGMVGNMENKICMSNTSATDVAYGRLHAGGAGQEGPISVTLSLFQSQISSFTQAMMNALPGAPEHLRGDALPSVVTSTSEPLFDGYTRKEWIIELLILQKNSPIETYRRLQIEGFWQDNPTQLFKDLDEACRMWSISQPSRVALSISPYLGSYGKSLDRYRSVRTTRDNEYFNNGRVELKLEFLSMNTSDAIMVANSNPTLRAYLLNTDYAQLNKTDVMQLITDYNASNQLQPREINTSERPTQDSAEVEDVFKLHVGVASLHQTMFDYSRNSTHIKQAVQDAEDAGLDILLLPELSLTGYFGDGDFDWIKNQEEGNKIFHHAVNIAQYAKTSNLIISMGLPVFIEGYAKPCVGQALLHRGKIISISLKTIQPDGEAEFEAMHFSRFHLDPMQRTSTLSIPNQEEPILIGKPVVILEDKNGHQVPIYHEQCAEAWAGVVDHQTVNADLQREQRYINHIALQYPGLLVLNPSGSKHDINYPKTLARKIQLGHRALDHNPNISGYMYVNVAGDDNGTVGGDADGYIIGRDGPNHSISHQSLRHTLSERNFTSMVISIPKTGARSAELADLLIQHQAPFNALNKIDVTHGGSAQFDEYPHLLDTKTREYTETTYATSAWILNTLRHHKKQCFVISLSGGADSTLGAVQIVAAIDLFIKEHAEQAQKSGLEPDEAQKHAIRALFDAYFSHLNYKDDVLATLEGFGADRAIKQIKQSILVCVYMPTANSSMDTLLSAKTLIEGGPRYALDKDGRLIKPLHPLDQEDVKGLGGRFIVSNLQTPMEEYILSYAGKSEHFSTQDPDLLAALERQRLDWPTELEHITDPEELFEKIIVLFSEKKLYDKDQLPNHVFPYDLVKYLRQLPPTWWNKSHDLTKQNLQPRLRSICPWLLAELYDGLPLFTSNLSEAAAGYSTWAGDTSLGYENGLGGILKSDVRQMLEKYELGELCGLEAMPSLFYVNHLEPSAELRPLDEEGIYTQTDEADLMPYANLDKIICTMILGKHTPWQTFELLRDARDHQGKPCFKDDEERALHIHKVCWLYQASQFKRTGGGNTPFLGRNLDPHLSQATTLVSQFFTNARVEMNLRYLAAKEGTQFDKELYYHAILNIELRQIIATTTPLSDIRDKITHWEEKHQLTRAPAISIFSEVPSHAVNAEPSTTCHPT